MQSRKQYATIDTTSNVGLLHEESGWIIQTVKFCDT